MEERKEGEGISCKGRRKKKRAEKDEKEPLR
jgi:hypothetical protein